MSALISMSVSKMAETIALIKDNQLRAAAVVGGAALTEDNARRQLAQTAMGFTPGRAYESSAS
jgi:cobalamin-dependent methionine synthase I